MASLSRRAFLALCAATGVIGSLLTPFVVQIPTLMYLLLFVWGGLILGVYSIGLTMLADRVRLDLEGKPSALVDVTPAAVAELSLASGSQVWLTAKATDLEVYPRADNQAR